ncbi:MAG: S8 family serine peptidase [Thermodesulfovibrionales bacterium]|nr:S8 family serine peptidase [Thermodesulfovibrionales bacterium]
MKTLNIKSLLTSLCQREAFNPSLAKRGEGRFYYIYVLLLLHLLVSCGSGDSPPAGQEAVLSGERLKSAPKGAYKEGELLVKFKPGGELKAQSAHRSAGATLKQRFKGIGVEHIKLPHGLSVADAVKKYMEDPDVEYAEPNYMIHKAVIPNDVYFGSQWGLHNTGQTISGDQGTVTGTVDADIDAGSSGNDGAWDLHTGLGNVIVAVLDTGIDYNHPDISANMWQNPEECALTNSSNGIDDDGNGYIDDCRGWNFAYGTPNPMDDDIDGHGTHAAGIIGAIGNNLTGVSGVNWSVKLMPLKFLDSTGSGNTSDELAAIDYAVMMRQRGVNIRAINASYAYTTSSCVNLPASIAEKSAISAAADAGILFVAAAGNCQNNNDGSPTYPASHNLPNIIAVLATEQKDNLAWFSNYGASSVHIAAPGMNIRSTIRVALGSYGYMSGTSMAAPHVSGLVALLSSYRPSYTYRELKEVILATSDRLGSLNGTLITEARINAKRALSLDPQAIIMPPSGVSAALVSASAANISWADNSANETDFNVEKKEGSAGVYALITTLPADTTTYQNTGLTEGITYYYRVVAVNSVVSGASSPSKGASVTTALSAPDSLLASASALKVDLSWTDNSNAETGFKVERKATSTGLYNPVATTGANVTTYTDTAFLPGVTYYYRVKAYTQYTDSAYTNEAGITTPGGSSPEGGGGGRCFIATAAYGSYLDPNVKVLRDFRDNYLLTNPAGRAFVRLYYRTSPPVADYIREHEILRLIARAGLAPFVFGIKYPFLSLLVLCLAAFMPLAIIPKNLKNA